MLTLSRKTGIWPERDVIKYIRSAIATDGLITRFAPGFNVGRYLEEVCQRWVAWEARRATLRYETFTGFAASSARLAQDGATRAASVLRRIVEGDTLARVDITTVGRSDDRLRRRTLRVAGVVVAFTALFELSGAPPQLGINLFTVEAVLVASALLALGDLVRRLASAG